VRRSGETQRFRSNIPASLSMEKGFRARILFWRDKSYLRIIVTPFWISRVNTEQAKWIAMPKHIRRRSWFRELAFSRKEREREREREIQMQIPLLPRSINRAREFPALSEKQEQRLHSDESRIGSWVISAVYSRIREMLPLFGFIMSNINKKWGLKGER